MYVVGAKARPVTCRYSLPVGWEVANGLLPTGDPSVRAARDYDTFADAPTILGIFRRFEFEVAGTPVSCVFWDDTQAYDFDMPAFVDVTRRIVEYQGQLFGALPFPFYVFLFTVSPFGGGGLEHLNSTSIGLNPAAMKRSVLAGASVTAHEFFHTWNVKRIRPVVLGPFEYQHENYTSNLWVSEGWTSYYGDLTLVRSHLIEPAEFLAKLEGVIRREFNKDRRKEHSVTWASRNVWHRWPDEEPRVDYYGKGELLGALIDLKIRNATRNGKSLDDVMRFFNRWFAEHNVGFEENDVERACTAVSNLDLEEFFARHVWGTVDPPLKEILAYAGIEYSEERLQADFPFTWRLNDGRVQVRQVGEGFTEEGLRRNDIVVSVDGQRDYDVQDLLSRHAGGEKLMLILERDGQESDMVVELRARETITPHLALSADPTPLQLEIRNSWLGIP